MKLADRCIFSLLKLNGITLRGCRKKTLQRALTKLVILQDQSRT